MINTFKERLLTFSEAASACPKVRGRRPSTVTLWRWATEGRRGIKLESVRIGRHMLTTETALNTFFNAVGSAPAVQRERQSKPLQAASATQREREITSARKRLIARGMLPKETEH